MSNVTVRKEVATFSAIWNKVAVPSMVAYPAPTRELDYGKARQIQPFHTIEQLNRKIERGGLTDQQRDELWDSVFLTLKDTNQILQHVRKLQPRGGAFRTTKHPFVYPMFVFAAQTGARRSEMLRSEIDDFSFDLKTVRIREKKKDRTKEMTYRHVPITPLLEKTMREWLARHPSGQLTLCRRPDVPIGVQDSMKCFKRVLKDSPWKQLKGWHVFRHSFASNRALRGVQPQVIDDWLGHQTVEMRNRYRHFFPKQHQQAMRSVFG